MATTGGEKYRMFQLGGGSFQNFGNPPETNSVSSHQTLNCLSLVLGLSLFHYLFRTPSENP